MMAEVCDLQMWFVLQLLYCPHGTLKRLLHTKIQISISPSSGNLPYLRQIKVKVRVYLTSWQPGVGKNYRSETRQALCNIVGPTVPYCLSNTKADSQVPISLCSHCCFCHSRVRKKILVLTFLPNVGKLMIQNIRCFKKNGKEGIFL